MVEKFAAGGRFLSGKHEKGDMSSSILRTSERPSFGRRVDTLIVPDNMYAPLDIEGQQYYLKPMNCPFHIQIYNSRIRSYRDLPLRFAEWARCIAMSERGLAWLNARARFYAG